MIAILIAKAKHLLRNPWTFLSFIGMSIGFAFITGSAGQENMIRVPVAVMDDEVNQSSIKTALEQEEAILFKEMEKKDMFQLIEDGKVEVGVLLRKDSYELVVGVESTTVTMVDNAVHQAYIQYLQQKKIVDHASESRQEKDAFVKEMNHALDEPVFTVRVSNFTSDKGFIYDSRYQFLFGFSLFFVIYTIGYNVLPILIEKQDGIWDRLILSPVKKWDMYAGNMIYSFFVGYLQVAIIFSFFYFIIGIDFNGMFMEALLLLIPYVFTIVALAILLTAVVKNAQQFNAVITIFAVCMAMIGGAYWPIEIVESKILIGLSKINPLTYGMEILHGAVNYGYSFEQLFYPISILLLMGVVMISIGIHLMEKRHI
ncbi:ABC transporter permease [Virgibacillus pantothenticus]|uniref:Multidrug ABC transporter permease n=1 Tax=Virgibacillus pantothenticus TaxID=1473 RepID=A0A0L0QT68_VIRPA|nr:ABC transporter permease [Virgibacillus pantothenticus]KNE21895.1 multidrug ABC transporter permease [Virgibacillus pantothenticus]MED3735232.1 ABC transporter permease [Virgibacillus pantothenticus]QTY17138.1 ABC transporter permease [Virgibacillus pantothenticus]SIS90381.1 ABC-2 type transport system permease protein [Virgibacillus pantothenticus]